MSAEAEASSGDVDERFDQFAKEIRDYLDSGFAADEGPLAFANLQRAGLTDLMAGIIKYGGYVRVAQRMQLDRALFIPPLKVAKSKVFPDFYQNQGGASLALGRNIDVRLEKEGDTVTAAPGAPPRTSARKGGAARVVDTVLTGAELRLQNERMAPRIVDVPIPAGESLALTAGMRIGILSLAASAALGFGRAGVTILPAQAQSACQALSEVLLLVHAALAVYVSTSVAPALGRDPTVWFAKVLLAGPLGVRSLRSLGPIAAADKSP